MDGTPETRFAQNSGLSIAYQVVGDGPIDLVFVPGFMSHVELNSVELRGDDVSGIAVHIASRVSALASPGEVLVSRTAKDLSVGSGVAFEDGGAHALKGVTDPWQLYATSV